MSGGSVRDDLVALLATRFPGTVEEDEATILVPRAGGPVRLLLDEDDVDDLAVAHGEAHDIAAYVAHVVDGLRPGTAYLVEDGIYQVEPVDQPDRSRSSRST